MNDPALKEAYRSVWIGYAHKNSADTDTLVKKSSTILIDLGKEPAWSNKFGRRFALPAPALPSLYLTDAHERDMVR